MTPRRRSSMLFERICASQSASHFVLKISSHLLTRNVTYNSHIISHPGNVKFRNTHHACMYTRTNTINQQPTSTSQVKSRPIKKQLHIPPTLLPLRLSILRLPLPAFPLDPLPLRINTL